MENEVLGLFQLRSKFVIAVTLKINPYLYNAVTLFYMSCPIGEITVINYNCD